MSRVVRDVALRIANSHFYSAGSKSRIIRDNELSADEASAYNLILIGDASLNSWTERVTKRLGVFTAAGFKIGPCTYGGPKIGLVATAPHWDNLEHVPRRALVIAGSDAMGLQSTVRSSFSMSQELSRPILTNMVPDYMVTGPELDWKGNGGILAAGFWGNRWGWLPAAGHVLC